MLGPATGQTGTDPGKVLGASTISATACFAAWTIFSIIGLEAKVQLGLSETEFGLLVGVPILSGPIARVPLGVWADRFRSEEHQSELQSLMRISFALFFLNK